MAHSNDLTGRVVAVTGGAKGIGRAIAFALAARGAELAVIDRDASALAELADLLGASETPHGHLFDVGDVTSDADVEAWFARIDQEMGPLFGLVNVVGGSPSYTAFEDLDLAEFDLTLEANLRSAFVCSRAAVERMLVAGEGRIVNIASIVTERAIPSLSAYCVAKAGLAAMTRSMAVELAPLGIFVNAVSPGHILTPAALRVVPTEIREGRDAVIPVGAHGRPEDVARTVLFALADSTFLTGADLRVDGGMGAAMPRPMAPSE